MYKEKEKRKGSRCNICTGCGRCFGGAEGIHLLTESSLSGVRGTVGGKPEEQGERAAQEGRRIAAAGAWERGRAPGGEGRGGAVCAVDLGTTTVAMILYDADGRDLDRHAEVNPQTGYGADVLSRVQAASDRRAAEEMRLGVRAVLERGLSRFRERTGLTPQRMVIAANTVMTYLLMGWDPAELGQAPFTVTHREPGRLRVGGVEALVLPGVSAFVGGDILAGILACGMMERREPSLLIDLGTNGEMVLGCRDRLLACSTAAGPAFEGGATKGIWGADMISLTAELLRRGIVDETGLVEEAYFDGGVRIGGALITQRDIRALQLAKGAIAAGIRVLAARYGLSSMGEIDRVYLAGGFGYYLDAADAARIGLFPEALGKRCVSVGNTALAGAALCADMPLGKAAEAAEAAGRAAEVFNLAQDETFEAVFLESLDLKKSVEFGLND